MSRRPRGAGNTRGGRGGGRGGGGIVVPPTLEAPLAIPNMKCWFDGRDAINTTSSGITSIVGSMGIVSLGQVTPGFRPTYVTSVPELGGRAALLFDGVDDGLLGTVPGDWNFMHNGTGASYFLLERLDSTGPGAQYPLQTNAVDPGQTGAACTFTATSVAFRVANGSGTYQNTLSISGANTGHFARDVARWRGWSYGAGVQTSIVSGSFLSAPDTVGQTPSGGAPQFALRLGKAASSVMKGYIPQLIIYDRVLTPAEWASLGAWAASQYPGVAA